METYELAIKVVEDAEVRHLLAETDGRRVVCAVDSNYNIIKRFYGDDPEFSHIVLLTNVKCISVKVTGLFYEVRMPAYNCKHGIVGSVVYWLGRDRF